MIEHYRIEQLNIYGKTKIEVAIERLKAFQPSDGYYLVFSVEKTVLYIKTGMSIKK